MKIKHAVIAVFSAALVATTACATEKLPIGATSIAGTPTAAVNPPAAPEARHDFTRVDLPAESEVRHYSDADSGAVVQEVDSPLGCTLGPAIKLSGNPGFVVAGHCKQNGKELIWRKNAKTGMITRCLGGV